MPLPATGENAMTTEKTERAERLARIGQHVANGWDIEPADTAWMHAEITRLDGELEAAQQPADEPGADDKPASRRKSKG